jgi:hypothetical protein
MNPDEEAPQVGERQVRKIKQEPRGNRPAAIWAYEPYIYMISTHHIGSVGLCFDLIVPFLWVGLFRSILCYDYTILTDSSSSNALLASLACSSVSEVWVCTLFGKFAALRPTIHLRPQLSTECPRIFGDTVCAVGINLGRLLSILAPSQGSLRLVVWPQLDRSHAAETLAPMGGLSRLACLRSGCA